MRNRGFTLLEVMITTALLAIAMTMLATSFYTVTAGRVKECAQEIDAMLAKCRVGSMSKSGSTCLRIRQNDEGVFADYFENGDAEPVETVRVGRKKIDCSAYFEGAASQYAIAENGPLYIAFERGTGKLLEVEEAVRLVPGASTSLSGFCVKIALSGGSTQRGVTIVYQTGKHYID